MPCRYRFNDNTKLGVIYEDVIKLKSKGHVIILGDMNCRTGIQDDFIENEHFSTSCYKKTSYTLIIMLFPRLYIDTEYLMIKLKTNTGKIF